MLDDVTQSGGEQGPRDAVLVDLDSTLADTSHRAHLVADEQGKRLADPDWDTYSMACADDVAIGPVAMVVQSLWRDGLVIVVVSGRSEMARELTEQWLRGVIVYHHLWMRPLGDQRPNDQFKVESARELAERENLRFVLAIEDWIPTCEALEREGIPSLIVANGWPASVRAGLHRQ